MKLNIKQNITLPYEKGGLKKNTLLLQELSERHEALSTIIEDKRHALNSVPDGGLRIQKRNNYYQYYLRSDPKDIAGKYIPKKDYEVAVRLAQKEYDRTILSIAEKEMNLIEKYDRLLKEEPIERTYIEYCKGRQELVTPVLLTDEQFVAKWKSEKYNPKSFEDSEEFYSASGIRVRSKAEVMIADMLDYYGIPYKYEHPLMLKGLGIVNPDFICLNVAKRREMIWEHFGMMDSISYANRNVNKIQYYALNGYCAGENMIMTFETSQFPIKSNIIRMKIEQFLM
jgi:hypothetical protein